MLIKFLGAAKTVTGSCYYVETEECKFLVDCGMFQGRASEDALNEESFQIKVQELDFVLLTHSHIDHSGRLPKLFIDGFKGKIIATKATTELCGIMLPDSGHIQEMENEWINRKRKRAGKQPIKPLYTSQDAIACMKLFSSVMYNKIVSPAANVKVRFSDAGHILGSAMIEIWITENGKETKIVFSGDIGNKDIPILRDPSIIESTDYLVMESTYGNRLHEYNNEDKFVRFIDIINETIEKGGKVVIPSFAVGRTQEIIYELNRHKDKYGDKMAKLFNIPVYVDSPLAINATEVFRNNTDCYDEEARAYIEDGDNPLDFPNLMFTKTADESRSLNESKESMIIIAASGMCDAGRIKHHLKHNLWRKENTILFVGFQAEGTLGQRIVSGAKNVKIFGEDVHVGARVEMIEGFSGHADKDGLINWLSSFTNKPSKIFIVHGEESVSNEFAETIKSKFGIQTLVPSREESFVISSEGVTERIENIVNDTTGKIDMLKELDILKKQFEDISQTVQANINKGMSGDEASALNEKFKIIKKALQIN